LEVLGRREEQRENLEQLEKTAQSMGTPYALATTYNRLSKYYTLIFELDKGIEYAQRAIETAKEDELSQERCQALLNLGTALWYSQKFDQALEAYQRGLAIAVKKEFYDLQTELLENVGVVLMNRGEFKESLEEFKKALQLLQTKHYDSLLEIKILGKLGAVYGNLEDYDKAIEYLEEQYEKASMIGAKKEMLQGIFNLAVSHYIVKKYERAMQAFKESLVLAEEIKFPRGILISKQSLGSLLGDLGQFESGKQLLEEVRKATQEQGMTEIEIKTCLDLSVIHYYLSNYEQAFDFALNAYNLAQQLGTKHSKVPALFSCALPMVEMGKYSNAEMYIQEGIDLATEINMSIERASFHILKARINREQKRLQEALENIEKGRALIPAKTPVPELHYERYSVLNARGEVKEAREAISEAYTIIINTASGINDNQLRASYLEKIPINRKIITAYKSIG